MAGARALLRATGVAREDIGKPIIAVANSFTEFVPGHVHLREVGQVVADAIRAAGVPVLQGDLARTALDLLAQDPAFAEPIRLMASQPPAASQRYLDPASAIALTTAALMVLQTRVKFKRDSSGKWSFEVDKKASSDGALKLVVQHLLSLLH